MKVMVTGGGTGGHLFPALAVADALRKSVPAPEIVFAGSATGIEATTVPHEGYGFHGLPVIGLPRRPGLGQMRAALAALRCVLIARRLLEAERPDVIFATGGFASAPILAAAYLNRVPVILHEQNSVPGLTIRIASRFAREVHLTFSSARRHFPKRRHLRLSGIPLREGVATGSRSKALRLFRLEDGRKTILVFGGSQGAHHLNEAILEAIARLSGRTDLQFVLQSGQNDYTWMVESCRGTQAKTWVRPFIPNMGDAYAVADLVVCRAGALTLGELSAVGKPAILVPYPHATADHQTLNAESFVEVGAATMIPDAELTGERLASEIEGLIADPRRRRAMSIQLIRMGRPEATERIVRAIRRVGERGQPPSLDETAMSKEPERRRGREHGSHKGP